jgi:hypothetical protein
MQQARPSADTRATIRARMSRVGVCLLLVLFAPACSDSPSGPSTNSAGFPDIRGTWVGSRSVDARLDDGTTTNNLCAERWTIQTQSNASFAGGFETGGAPCLQQAGSLEGTITTTGAIATLSLNLQLGPGGPCAVIAQSTLTGGFVGRTVDIRFADEITCSSGPGTFRSTRRTVAVALMRE